MISRVSHPHLRLLVLLTLLATLVGSLVAPAAAEAGSGQRWPGTRITYFDATRDKAAVARAVTAWNRSGIRMRFVRVFDRRRAQVVIRNSRAVPGGCGTGVATLGYTRGRQGFVNILHGLPSDGQACGWPGQTFVVAHELGHVLGLEHDDRACALMNSSHTGGIAGSRCIDVTMPIERFSQWRCRILEPRDVRRAIRLYGGTARAVRANPWCDLVGRIEAPLPLTVGFDELGAFRISLRRPADPVAPPFLRRPGVVGSYEVYSSEGECLTSRPAPGGDVHPIFASSWNVEAGQVESQMVFPPGTPRCYSAWSVDAYGRASVQPATATYVPPTDAAFARRRGGSSLPGEPLVEPDPTEPDVVDLSGDIRTH